MTNNIQQSAECREHYMLLTDQLVKINCLLFGCPDKPNEIPMTTKVNIMFGIMIFLVISLCGTLGTLASLTFKAGIQLNEIKNMSIALDNHLDQAKDFEKRLNQVEFLVYKSKTLK